MIGGPPCQAFSRGAARARGGWQRLAANLIPEFVRVVREAAPAWYLAENVPESPAVVVPGYGWSDTLVENLDCGGEQRRCRRFTFGSLEQRAFELPESTPRHPSPIPTVTRNATLWDRGKKRSFSERSPRYLALTIRAQGLPDGFTLPGHTVAGAIAAIAQGVPLPMGRAVARAALGAHS